jgi:hypothetical protein
MELSPTTIIRNSVAPVVNKPADSRGSQLSDTVRKAQKFVRSAGYECHDRQHERTKMAVNDTNVSLSELDSQMVGVDQIKKVQMEAD